MINYPQLLKIDKSGNEKLHDKNNVSVCFATFDDTIGPVSAYHKHLDDVTASDIVVKVMIGSLSLHTDNNSELCGESIIPFGKQNMIAFSYFFTIPAPKLRGGQRSCSLIILMDAKDQLQMYRLAPFLSSQCKKVSDIIKDKYMFGKSLPNVVKQGIDSLLDVQSYKVEIEEFYAARKITITKSKTKGSMQFLNKVIKKDLDKAILAILIGKPVVVTGDEVMTEIAIASLELFAPHKELKKVFWTNQIVEADLIGTRKNLAKAYDDAVIVDLIKGKISGGESSKFCRDLLSSLRGIDEKSVEGKINERISEIITSASLLSELAMRKEITKGDISNVAPMFNSEKMGIIVTIAKSMNPVSTNKIEYLAPIIAREASTYDVFA
jgi:polyhydroxyalkanoate synthesis regulator phasin